MTKNGNFATFLIDDFSRSPTPPPQIMETLCCLDLWLLKFSRNQFLKFSFETSKLKFRPSKVGWNSKFYNPAPLISLLVSLYSIQKVSGYIAIQEGESGGEILMYSIERLCLLFWMKKMWICCIFSDLIFPKICTPMGKISTWIEINLCLSSLIMLLTGLKPRRNRASHSNKQVEIFAPRKQRKFGRWLLGDSAVPITWAVGYKSNDLCMKVVERRKIFTVCF